ncbi:MAG: outer membrane protein assembly factor BamA, partial [Bryobacterales bacterium]|nr:outer membrane protein assembly factor BamA [Bryobacterales bacterium]
MRRIGLTFFAALIALFLGAPLVAEDGAQAESAAPPAGPVAAADAGDPSPGASSRPYLLAQAAQQAPSPFEDIPLEEPDAPSPFQDVEEEQQTAQRPGEEIVEAVEFRGTRRIPRDSLAARIFTKRGDLFDAQTLRRDFMVLWNTGYFDDLRLEIDDGEQGKIVRFVVTERRVVRTIRYEGNKSATLSDILERF